MSRYPKTTSFVFNKEHPVEIAWDKIIFEETKSKDVESYDWEGNFLEMMTDLSFRMKVLLGLIFKLFSGTKEFQENPSRPQITNTISVYSFNLDNEHEKLFFQVVQRHKGS